VSGLRSAIDELRAETLSDAPDARIEADLIELHAIGEAVEAERLRRLAEFDRRRIFERDGHLSAVSWVATRLQVAWGVARRDVVHARQLERMPVARAALDAGTTSLAATRMLADARSAHPESFDEAESALVEGARAHALPDLRRVLAHWRAVVERDRSSSRDDDDRARAARRLHASVTLGGMVRVDGDLDPETGSSLLTALGAVVDAERRTGGDDGRTAPQRRADALGEICRAFLDRSDRPEVGGERPHLSVTVPIAALSSPAGVDELEQTRLTEASGAELDPSGPIALETARRLACDAAVTRIVLGPRSEPLDVGRRTPVVPPAIRRAVVARDRHCRFPGCDRPQAWCDAHHVRHWADGGSTSVANLVLLCRRHHRLTHERFAMELVDGRPVFRRPDGTLLDADRAPP
jgi:hypothetical protein